MDRVDFISQFVNGATATGCYINNRSLAETARNIIGTPTNFPNYGDFSKTLVMRTYGFDISGSPWQDNYVSQNHRNSHYNYIDLEFHEAVYPIRVSIYEVYNPGYVTKIWAQDSDDRWFLLWSGQRQIVPATSRIFSPPLSHPCNFKTKTIRLKFMSSVLKYSSQLDAVQLIGTSKLICPKEPEQSLTNLIKRINCMYPCHQDIHNLTPDPKNAHLDILDLQKKFLEYCSICESDISSKDKKYHRNHHLNNTKYNTRDNIKLPSVIKEKSLCKNLLVLPDEIILKILKNLDMRSLSHMYAVNKRLRRITRDRSLFKLKCLNLRNIQYKNSTHIHNIISFFAPTSKFLKQLDLTSSGFSVAHLLRLINKFGRFLTHLRLRDCDSVNNLILFKISRICKNLKVLDLAAYWGNALTDKGLSNIRNIKGLEHLDLRMTFRTAKPVCKILQKTRRMRVLLCPGGVTEDLDADAITMQLRNSCPDLEILDISGGIISSRNIDDLCECKNLQKLCILWMNDGTLYRDFHRLFSSCQRLEEINLVDHHDDINELTLSKDVKVVYLRQLSSSAIFEQHPKLKAIHVMHDRNGDFFAQMKEKYPHVSIWSLISGECLV